MADQTRNDPPVELLYARIGRLTVALDATQNMLAATQRALKESDAECVRLKPFEADAANLRETLAELEDVNRALKGAWESTQVVAPKAAPFIEVGTPSVSSDNYPE